MGVVAVIKRLFRLLNIEICSFSCERFLDLKIGDLLAKHQVDLVVDVGANTGQFYRMIRSLGYDGEIISFEPGSDAFKALLNIDDARWRRENLALGSSPSTEILNVYSSNLFSSFRKPSEFGQTKFEEELYGNSPEEVEITTLVEYFKGRSENRMFVKVDTQGFDLEVLKGAGEIMDRIVLAQVEVSVKNIYADSPSYIEVFSYLVACGFHLSGIYPMNVDTDGSWIEADAIFVKVPKKF